MPITHAGDEVPTFDERMDPSDIETFWISWAGKLGGASIQASTWVMPDGFTELEAFEDQSVSDADSNTYNNANGVRVSTTKTTGKHMLTNRVTLSDGRRYDRSAYVLIAQQ